MMADMTWPCLLSLGMNGWTPDSGLNARHFIQRVALPAAIVPQPQPTPPAKTYTKSQLPYQIHPLHTLITLDTTSFKYSGSVQTQITSSPQAPQRPLVQSQQHLWRTGFETDCLTTVVTSV